MTVRGFRLLFGLTAAACLYAGQVDLKRAEEQYSRTDYSASLQTLRGIHSPDGPSYFLYGRNYFMLSE
jgi:hypothetical protein